MGVRERPWRKADRADFVGAGLWRVARCCCLFFDDDDDAKSGFEERFGARCGLRVFDCCAGDEDGLLMRFRLIGGGAAESKEEARVESDGDAGRRRAEGIASL